MTNMPESTVKPTTTFIVRYGDGAGNTVEENSSIFSLIRLR